ncbi:TetR family transcriptional regulator [Lentzea sp. NBRC 105346]|uniref:TetR/AcrR family transcriptional regulator n=1 Tax=Lentzea sp. NBRC 105346 TaxID=3032205 RepID=UPI0024A203D7|nr:helix-turn-helix domain-containing protein [Lentzea sp. NBRC 105346]GLZ28809.1 TetR family transcriptional regulator [Lentzea sp. NBRC 105346]
MRADAQRNRAKVLSAAASAFASGGFGVPLDEIAALAGVGPGTVYRHFPTKEALFQAVMEERIASLIDFASSSSADPGAAFFAFLGRIGEEAALKRDLSDAFVVPSDLQARLHEAFNALLVRAQAAGAVRRDLEFPDLLALLKGLLAGLAETSRPERLLAVVMDGLRA